MPSWITDEPRPSLGLGYIAAVLRENDVDVGIIDINLPRHRKNLRNLICKYDPDIIGISAMTPSYAKAQELAKISKEVSDATVVMGGPHPTVMTEDVLKNKNIDIVVIGEGEYTFLDIVQSSESGSSLSEVKGIYYKKQGIIKTEMRNFIQDLDELPYPARDLFDMKYYLSKVPSQIPRLIPDADIIAMRGCPFRCSYCQPTLKNLFGKKIRTRNSKRVIDEMELLVNKYKVKSIGISGDSLTVNKKWFYEFCDEIKNRGIITSWVISTRVNLVDRELLRRMNESGGFSITFGVESGSQRILDEVMNKGTKIEETKNAFKWCKEAGIFTMANIMIGSPTETKEDVLQTLRLIKEIEPDATSLFVTNPVPGTKLYDYSIEKGLLLEKDVTKIDRHALSTLKRELSDWELEGYLKFIWYTSTLLQLSYVLKPWKYPHYLRYNLRRDLSVMRNKPILFTKTWINRIKIVMVLLKDKLITTPRIRKNLGIDL